MSEVKTCVIRIEGAANRYGLGEIISEDVVFFHDGDYNLTREELEKKLSSRRVIIKK